MTEPTYDRWWHVDATFSEALTLPPAERPAFLDAVCADDAVLRREVDDLLAAYEASEQFLEDPADWFEAPLLPGLATDGEAVPVDARQVGPYRLLREIGRGGMGVVYLAERIDGQFQQRVALKLIRSGFATEDALRRFRLEREILARLQHPHIARLLDGGVTKSGWPYFVMEYVAGIPITAYSDAHRLDITERLALFREVCAAVHYAHQNLVVHRDLTPGNIMVIPASPETGSPGRVKLLDFGIAKLLDEASSPVTVPVTQNDMRVMTLDYASPEQVQGQPITTASDVYQLGVLLYELLAGHRPYRVSSRLLHEVKRVICEETPERPSMVVLSTRTLEAAGGAPSVTPADVSRTRNTSTERLHRRLKGDLDNIVLMAMRKEPERRYASVEQLRTDLQRHLARRPVLARPDTMFYRTSAFIRRHRVAVAALSVIMLLLISFAGAMAVQANRIARERDRAEEATSFLVNLFQEFEPGEALGSTATSQDVLDRGVEQIRHELHDQPLMQAQMMDVIGQVYQFWSRFPEAERLLREALALRLEHLGPDHFDVADSRRTLAELLDNMGRPEEPERLLREALRTYRRKLGDAHPTVARGMIHLAIVLRTQGDLHTAEGLLRDVVADAHSIFGEAHVDLALALRFLGRIRVEQGDYQEAEALLREALAMERTLFGEYHPKVANALDGLGELMRARRDYAAAERFFREAFALRDTLFDEANIDIATSLENLAFVLHDQGKYAAAEPLLRQALAIVRTSFEAEHTMMADHLHYLASSRTALGDLEEADSLFQASLAIWQRNGPGMEHPALARTLNSLGLLRQQQGAADAADTLVRKALAMRRALLPGDHLDVAESVNSLALLQHERGAYATAVSLYREGLAIQRKRLSEGQWPITRTLSRLGTCLMMLARYDEAEPLLLESYQGFQDQFGDQHGEVANALDRLITLYEAWGKAEDAERYRALRAAMQDPG